MNSSWAPDNGCESSAAIPEPSIPGVNSGPSKRNCANPECGHPRAEHRSRFLSDINDYEYQECTVLECPCQDYIGEIIRVMASIKTEVAQEPQSCRACGSDLLGHTFLGPECLTVCESNWKKLRALQACGPTSREDNGPRTR